MNQNGIIEDFPLGKSAHWCLRSACASADKSHSISQITSLRVYNWVKGISRCMMMVLLRVQLGLYGFYVLVFDLCKLTYLDDPVTTIVVVIQLKLCLWFFLK